MYNESVKQRFLSDYLSNSNGKMEKSRSTEHSFLRIFDAMEPIEAECACDFSNLPATDMQRAFDTSCGNRYISAENAYYLLKVYIRWCQMRGVGSGEAFEHLALGSVDKARDTWVASPSHLKSILDLVFPEPDRNSIEYIYRAALWIAFIGFTEEEASKVKAAEVDLERMEIVSDFYKSPFRIFGEARTDLYYAKTLTEFIEPRGKHGVAKQRATGEELLRGKVTQKTMQEYLETTVRQLTNKAFKKAGSLRESASTSAEKQRFANVSLTLSYKRIYESGIFYRAYERERIGFNPLVDFRAKVALEVSRKIQNGEYTINANQTETKVLNKNIGIIENDYILWKCAFTV